MAYATKNINCKFNTKPFLLFKSGGELADKPK